MRYVLLHVSDLHAGPPFNPVLAQQLTREAHELQPDLVVISGDLVQRADFPGQWRTINRLIATLPEPRLIVPGNHDVPMINIFARVFRPLETYRRNVTPDLNPVFERPGLVVVGGVTAHGLTIDGGRLSTDQQQRLTAIFARYPVAVCKVLVLHHHVINPPGCEGRSTISNAEEVVNLFDRWGVDMLLCGHIHVSYVGTTLDVRPNQTKGTIICQSGTTTSRRGKSRERGKNSYNVIVIEDKTIRIVQHLFLEELGRFAPVAEHIFPHRAAGAYTLPGVGKIPN